jgi:hypothetical protein
MPKKDWQRPGNWRITAHIDGAKTSKET